MEHFSTLFVYYFTRIRILNKPPFNSFNPNQTVDDTAWMPTVDNYLTHIPPDKNFHRNHVKKSMKQLSRTQSTKMNHTQGTYLYSKPMMRYILLGSEVTADLAGTIDPK